MVSAAQAEGVPVMLETPLPPRGEAGGGADRRDGRGVGDRRIGEALFGGGCAAGGGHHGIECVAAAVIGDDAVHARLAVPDPVLLEEGDGAAGFVDGFDDGVVVAVALARLGGGVGNVAGLRRVCNLKPAARGAGDGQAAVVRVHADAVDGGIEALDQLVAEQRPAGLIIQGVHAAEGVGDEILALDHDVVGTDGRLAARAGAARSARQSSAADRRRKIFCMLQTSFRIGSECVNCNRL